jgi:uncharacterized protein YkwD
MARRGLPSARDRDRRIQPMAGASRYCASRAARIGIALAATLGVSVFLAGPGIGAHAEASSARNAAVVSNGPCPNANRPATEVSRKLLRRATICQINRLRVRRGRDSVRRRNQLQRVAQRHTRTMVATECLKHRCPGEPALQRRIRRSGYLKGARRWRFTQSTGCAASARAMVRAWNASRFHRQNMLGPRLDHVGIGTVPQPAVARCGEDTATFTALFAWRAR